jgi:hypothetical protein
MYTGDITDVGREQSYGQGASLATRERPIMKTVFYMVRTGAIVYRGLVAYLVVGPIECCTCRRW